MQNLFSVLPGFENTIQILEKIQLFFQFINVFLDSQILILQDIRSQKLGKSGSKFRHGGGEFYKQRPKKFLHLLWLAPYQIKTGRQNIQGWRQMGQLAQAPSVFGPSTSYVNTLRIKKIPSNSQIRNYCRLEKEVCTYLF